MAVIISENYASREFTLGRQRSREIVYDVLGTDDETVVEAQVRATAPPVYGGLGIEDVECVPVEVDAGDAHRGIWKVRVKYQYDDDGSEFTFDTGGGTAHVTQALETVARYAPPGPASCPDTLGAIGASGDRVEGADIVVPSYQFTERHRIADAVVMGGYKGTLFNLTGRMNDAPFKSLDTGECLFLGASGQKRGFDSFWDILYRFAGSPNATGLAVGDITGIAKLGWDLLDIQYAEFADLFAFHLVQRPIGVQVQRVYRFGDFSAMAIGT
jgi:hypothetical protein